MLQRGPARERVWLARKMGQSVVSPEARNKEPVVRNRDGGRGRLLQNCGRSFKLVLHEEANNLGLLISVCHYALGMSNHSKIKHRIFCHGANNWLACPQW